MTTQDRNIMTKELRGWNLRNVLVMLGLAGGVLKIAYNHYNSLKSDMGEIKTELREIRISQKFQQQVLDRHESILTTSNH